MSEVRHFTDLKVWQRGHERFVVIAKDVDSFPRKPAARTIADQILRSAGSIGANIAEGFSAPMAREYLRCLDIARRSANETENWICNLAALGYLGAETARARLDICEEVRRMLFGLRKSLKGRSSA